MMVNIQHGPFLSPCAGPFCGHFCVVALLYGSPATLRQGSSAIFVGPAQSALSTLGALTIKCGRDYATMASLACASPL
jgi:hypothetical protein